MSRDAILKAAMEAGCDEAERLGYGSQLGYVEAASIGEKAATVALEQLAGAVDDLREVARLLDRSTQTGKAPTQDEWAALGLANATLDRLGGQ